MAKKWIDIPEDVVAWFRDAFAEANRQVSEIMLNVPSIRETSLDDTLIQALIPKSPPTLMPSGALVRMDIHNIGGLRRVQRWEVADIAVLVFIIREGAVIGRKIGLLQAKRLYPLNSDVDDIDPVGFQYGLNAFLNPNPSPTSMALARRFDFEDECKYGEIRAGSDQLKRMEAFSQRSGFPVDYLLYNPPTVPVQVSYPIVSRHVLERAPALGCRVVAKSKMRKVIKPLSEGQAPTLRQVRAVVGAEAGWRLEYWAADLLLRCKAGRKYEAGDEQSMLPMIERRTGPIGAAIAVKIELAKG